VGLLGQAVELLRYIDGHVQDAPASGKFKTLVFVEAHGYSLKAKKGSVGYGAGRNASDAGWLVASL
jgi:hypothetical protein